jgi:hypothetical protein
LNERVLFVARLVFTVLIAAFGCTPQRNNTAQRDKLGEQTASSSVTSSASLAQTQTSEDSISTTAVTPSSSTAVVVHKGSPQAFERCQAHVPETRALKHEVPGNWVTVQQCTYGKQDAWRVELSDFWDNDGTLEGCATLVHIRADGSRTARLLPGPRTLASCQGQACWAATCEPFALEYVTSYSIGPVYDWDEDGEEEVAIAGAVTLPQGRSIVGVIVVDDAERSLRHLPATLPLTISAVRDVDDDGRPDFLLPFSSGMMADEFGIVAADQLELLAHSQARGALSLNDAVARQHAASQCPKPDLSQIADEVSLLCAKLRRVPRHVAIRAFRRNCDGKRHGGCETDPESTWDEATLPFQL